MEVVLIKQDFTKQTNKKVKFEVFDCLLWQIIRPFPARLRPLAAKLRPAKKTIGRIPPIDSTQAVVCAIL